MERNQELFEKIELYLKGELAADEHENFENELKYNPELQGEVELHRFLETESKNLDSLEFRRKLISVSTKKKRPYRWSIAASVIILIGSFTLFWFLSNVDENPTLFDKYYSVYPVEDVIRGNKKSKIKKIEADYANHRYVQIIPELKLLVSKEPENQLLKMYLGNSQLQTDQIRQALLLFKKVDRKSAFYEDAQWYLALSYLKLDMMDETLPILKAIVKHNGKHQKNARSLLNELEVSIHK